MVFFWRRFFQGVAIGISVAAPIGPMALLCISRTLVRGRLTGFISGLAAATVDLLYASVGAFGLGAVSSLMLRQQFWLRLLGGSYLLYLAVVTFRQVPKQVDMAQTNQQGLLMVFVSTVGLNLANPLTIMPFFAMFAGAGFSTGNDRMSAVAIVVGVFVGASSWWLFLSAFCSAFRTQFGLRRLRVINRLSALAIGAFALYSLCTSTIR